MAIVSQVQKGVAGYKRAMLETLSLIPSAPQDAQVLTVL